MPELIFEHTARMEDAEGRVYAPRTHGRARADGNWVGWIEFHSLDDEGPVLRTDTETTQPSRAALSYWASGLEPVYFDGAFARAGELTSR